MGSRGRSTHVPNTLQQWLNKNFHLSQATAYDHMRLANLEYKISGKTAIGQDGSAWPATNREPLRREEPNTHRTWRSRWKLRRIPVALIATFSQICVALVTTARWPRSLRAA
jgi:hypothetical protein